MKLNRIVNVPREETKLFNELDSNPTYGELTKQGACQLINQIKQKDNCKKFCDLGSGIGIVLKYMTDLMPHLEQIDGIELSEERYNQSINLIKNKIKDKDKKKRISIVNDDLMTFNTRSYDIIYISNLCFNHSFNTKLSQKLDKELKNNSIVFASQDLCLTRFHIKTTFSIHQSWGQNTQMFKYEIIE